MMLSPERQYAQAKVAREAAHGAFRAQLAQVRADVSARSVGGRIADRVTETAVEVMDDAVTIADEHRGVIAGTIAALAAWFLRRPIMRLTRSAYGAVKERISHD